MFSRWTQENLFKYLRQDYDFDRMLQYAVQQLDNELVVPNPEYNNKTYHLGKLREKIARRKAALYDLQQKNLNDDLDNARHYLDKQLDITEQLHELQARETELLDQRSRIPSRIKIKDMDEQVRYNKLHTESKRFQNMIKMICYQGRHPAPICYRTASKKA